VNIPSVIGTGVTGKSVYIVGARYVGPFGVGGGSSIGNLTVIDTTVSTTNAGSTIVLATTSQGTVNINNTTALQISVGTTAQRPTTPSTGDLRFNSTTTSVEVYNGSGWVNVGDDTAEITSQSFAGDNSTVAFTLNASATTASVLVSINGTMQAPTTAYAVSGATLTFTEAPLAGDVIEVRKISTLTTISEISNGLGDTISVDANGIAQFATVHSLQLPIYTVTQANALSNRAAGQLIYVSNGDSGSPSLAVYNGSNWQKVVFGGAISAA
jgi:hypothetical protein